MVQKLPPPPQLTGPEWQSFNRWLLELTSILNASGGIDPSSIVGYTALQNQVATNTADIASLGLDVGGQGASIAGLQFAVNALQISMTAANAQITALGARAQVLNGTVAPLIGQGNNNDWYSDTAAKKIYVKVAGAWVTIV